MHVLVRFAPIAAANTFTTKDIYPHTLKALGLPPTDYSVAALRSDLQKLRAEDLFANCPAPAATS
jgi:hypothetical protein